MYTTSQNTVKHCSISLLVLLAGCGPHRPTFNLKPLQPRTAYDQLTKKTECGDVTVRCAPCSRKDLHEIFGKPGNALLAGKKGTRITPVQLCIENNSGYTWSLSPYDIRLPLADIGNVKSRFVCGAAARGLTSYTLTSGCGIALASIGAATSIFHPLIGASVMGVGCSLLLIAPVRSHTKTAQISAQNMHFAHVIDNISLTDELVIHPRQQVSKLIYVEDAGEQESFMLRLCNQDNLDHTIAYNLYFKQDRRN